MLSFSPLNVGIGLIGGAALGGVYFGGLWLSVKKTEKHRKQKKVFVLQLDRPLRHFVFRIVRVGSL